MFGSHHSYLNSKKRKLKIKSILRSTTELKLQGKPPPETLERQVNIDNHNLLGAEATGRNIKVVTDELRETECKLA